MVFHIHASLYEKTAEFSEHTGVISRAKFKSKSDDTEFQQHYHYHLTRNIKKMTIMTVHAKISKFRNFEICYFTT